MLSEISQFLKITHSEAILRRYFVVNGFDGAMTMLGLIIGFILSGNAELKTALTVCLGAALALAVSGISSAYLSEHSERIHALTSLQQAMLADLSESEHAKATRWVPWMVAAVNGFSPLLISLFILTPLWLATLGIAFPFAPLYIAVLLAGLVVFLLGVFLGRLSGVGWLKSGVRSVLIALFATTLIVLLAG